MIDQLKTGFPQIIENDCLWKSTKPKIYILDPKDDERKIVEVDTIEQSNFVIENPNQKEIAILAIDKCVFNDQSGFKKCDFAAFDNAAFIFVEIKDTNRKKSSSSKKTDAKDQLESTIIELKKKIDFARFKMFAIICWRYKRTYPAQLTKMQNAAKYFQDKYKVKLIEGNQFTFN